MLSRRVLFASALSVAASLGACGGGSGDAPAPVPAPVPTPIPPPPPPPPPPLPPLVTDTEIRVSAPSPFAVGCATGTGTEYRNAEVEPTVAINPMNPNNLVVSWQQDRWSSGGASGVVSAATIDGGITWIETPMPFTRCGGGDATNGGNYARGTDPWLTFSPDGSVYQMALAFQGASLQPGSSSAMLVARSTDGGLTWGPTTPLIVSGSTFFNDKNTITADPTDARFVYAVWDRLALAGGGPSLMARTTDSGTTWEGATVIYDPGPQSQTIGNQIVVVPNGTLLNVFTRIDPGPNNTNLATIHVIRSTDRGATWSPPIKVADLLAVGVRDPVTNVPVRDGSDVAEAAVAPNGQVWVVWQDARFSGGTIDGIALARSTDGGLTWSTPAQVNSAPAVQAFTPSIRVRPDGTIGVTYFDLRSNTADPTTLPTDLILARSSNGVAWTEVRLTPTFDLDTAPLGAVGPVGGYFLGDYQGLVATGNTFVPVYVRTTGDPANRTDVYAVFTRSITAQPIARIASTGPLPPLAPDAAQRVSDNVTRVMERRVPGWLQWRNSTRQPR